MRSRLARLQAGTTYHHAGCDAAVYKKDVSFVEESYGSQHMWNQCSFWCTVKERGNLVCGLLKLDFVSDEVESLL